MEPKQAAMVEAQSFVSKLNDVFLFPLIFLLSGIAFVFFVYGAAMYVINADSEQGRADGKKHIMYGLIGLFIMASAYAILTIGTGTFGLTDELDCARNPKAAGCESAFEIPD